MKSFLLSLGATEVVTEKVAQSHQMKAIVEVRAVQEEVVSDYMQLLCVSEPRGSSSPWLQLRRGEECH